VGAAVSAALCGRDARTHNSFNGRDARTHKLFSLRAGRPHPRNLFAEQASPRVARPLLPSRL